MRLCDIYGILYGNTNAATALMSQVFWDFTRWRMLCVVPLIIAYYEISFMMWRYEHSFRLNVPGLLGLHVLADAVHRASNHGVGEWVN